MADTITDEIKAELKKLPWREVSAEQKAKYRKRSKDRLKAKRKQQRQQAA